MALNAKEIALCNVALLRIGHTIPIVTDGEATDHYRVANAMYATARDYVLAARDWEFATKRAALAGKATSTVTLWAYSYTYPADAIKIRRILGAAASPRRDEKIPFQVNNTGTALQVLTNENDASVEYTAQITGTDSPDLFDPTFYSALAYYLASEFAVALKAEPTIAKGALDAYMALLKAAEDPKAQEGYAETTISLVAGGTLTDVVVCNMALGRLGYKSLIASLTENTDAARLCSMFYPRVLARIVRSFPWSFCTARATLVAAGGTAPTNWGYKWVLPTDCVFPREIVNPLGRAVRSDQRIRFETATETITATVTRVLYCDLDAVELIYTSNTYSSPANWDAAFVDAFIWDLASELVLGLGGDPKLVNFCQQRFALSVANAGTLSFNEGQEDAEPTCEFLSVRS